MAGVPFNVSYTQDDDGQPGRITLNAIIKSASGRLDKQGDFVFADGFSAEGFNVTVECVRTSKKTMQIRIIFVSGSNNALEDGQCYEIPCTVVEKVLDDVKIDFDNSHKY